jgi:hypothetical protein
VLLAITSLYVRIYCHEAKNTSNAAIYWHRLITDKFWNRTFFIT